MKRCILFAVACLLVGGLCACDDDDDGKAGGDGNAATTPQPDQSGCYWSMVPDAVSEASQPYYYNSTFYQGQQLLDLISGGQEGERDNTTVLVLSTVRCDGTPNIAIFGTTIINEEILAFYSPDSLTRESILANKYARLLVRTIDPAGVNKYDNVGHGGARLLLKLVEDEAELTEYWEIYNSTHDMTGESMSTVTRDDFIFMRIVETYPLG